MERASDVTENVPTIENMTDIGVQLTPNSPGQPVFDSHRVQEDMGGQREPDAMESLLNQRPQEVVGPLALLANVALAAPCGDKARCSCDSWPCLNRMARHFQSMQMKLQFLLREVEDLSIRLLNGQSHPERGALAAGPGFLSTHQPYFDHLESAAWTSISFDIYTKHLQLLNFSQQLCDRWEQLVLTYASHNLLSLDETEPNNVSHFCIGHIQLGRLKLTMFRYCKPTPYLARVNTGLFKRMRWNVEILCDGQPADEEQGGGSGAREADKEQDTEYFFLCYEDILNEPAEVDRASQGSSMVRMWSIGQWVQVKPDPNIEDIYDWILCDVPEANYNRMLFLGSEEPNHWTATVYLKQLLVSRQATE